MPDYRPSKPPDTDDVREIKSWAQQEFEQLSILLSVGALVMVPVRTVAPDKPRKGMIVYADGTTWNPGSGEGFYGYQGSAWVKL